MLHNFLVLTIVTKLVRVVPVTLERIGSASSRSLGVDASRLFESLSKVFRTAAGIEIIIVQGP